MCVMLIQHFERFRNFPKYYLYYHYIGCPTLLPTCSSLLGVDGEVGWLVDHPMTQAGAVRRHVAAVDCVHVEQEGAA